MIFSRQYNRSFVVFRIVFFSEVSADVSCEIFKNAFLCLNNVYDVIFDGSICDHLFSHCFICVVSSLLFKCDINLRYSISHLFFARFSCDASSFIQVVKYSLKYARDIFLNNHENLGCFSRGTHLETKLILSFVISASLATC